MSPPPQALSLPFHPMPLILLPSIQPTDEAFDESMLREQR
jgi:hypothetical protein